MLFSKKTTPNPVGLLGQRDWKGLDFLLRPWFQGEAGPKSGLVP